MCETLHHGIVIRLLIGVVGIELVTYTLYDVLIVGVCCVVCVVVRWQGWVLHVWDGGWYSMCGACSGSSQLSSGGLSSTLCASGVCSESGMEGVGTHLTSSWC